MKFCTFVIGFHLLILTISFLSLASEGAGTVSAKGTDREGQGIRVFLKVNLVQSIKNLMHLNSIRMPVVGQSPLGTCV